MWSKLKNILDQIGLTTSIGLSIRHALTAFAGALAAKGIIDGSAVESLVGAVMVILGVVWSAAQKFQANADKPVSPQ